MVYRDNEERKGRQGQQQRETWQIVTTVRNMVDRTNGEKNGINCTEREKVDRDKNREGTWQIVTTVRSMVDRNNREKHGRQ